VTLTLYTKSNPDQPEQLTYNDIDGITKSQLDINIPTVFITHGFLDSQLLTTWMQQMKDAYFARNDIDRNVILVGWSPANIGIYEKATSNTRVVGAMIAVFIRNFIVKNSNFKKCYFID
jgi:poly(3-hydroxyalkanoate) synthetase